jgi:hypothetical protein
MSGPMDAEPFGANERMLEDEDGAGEQTPVPRTECTWASHSTRFITPSKQFSRQYQHLYYQRLLLMRPLLLRAAQSKWTDSGTALTEIGVFPRFIYHPCALQSLTWTRFWISSREWSAF